MKDITILVPTYNRLQSLAVLLTSLCTQTYKNFDIIISDQSERHDLIDNKVIHALIRVLNHHGHKVKIHRHLPRRGIAEHRHFLLQQAKSPYVLFLDDDLILESYVVKMLLDVIEREQCGFVGQAVQGLSYIRDNRPQEEHIYFWKEKVLPEIVKPNSVEWERYTLHNAANLMHVAEKYHITPDSPRTYKIAWIGGCVMYNREKLIRSGGFRFWHQLPPHHCGEDVLAQMRTMKWYGGCGIIPSGVFHQEVETTIKDRTINAPEYFTR